MYNLLLQTIQIYNIMSKIPGKGIKHFSFAKSWLKYRVWYLTCYPSAALYKLYTWKLEVMNRGQEVTPQSIYGLHGGKNRRGKEVLLLQIIMLVFARKDSPAYIDDCTACRINPLYMGFVLLVNKINLLIQQGKGTIFSNCATREGEKFIHHDEDRNWSVDDFNLHYLGERNSAMIF